jgi:hypothetical protein
MKSISYRNAAAKIHHLESERAVLIYKNVREEPTAKRLKKLRALNVKINAIHRELESMKTNTYTDADGNIKTFDKVKDPLWVKITNSRTRKLIKKEHEEWIKKIDYSNKYWDKDPYENKPVKDFHSTYAYRRLLALNYLDFTTEWTLEELTDAIFLSLANSKYSYSLTDGILNGQIHNLRALRRIGNEPLEFYTKKFI